MPALSYKAQIYYRLPDIEYAISDKVHVSHQHGGRNTRLQDAYDLYVFLTKCTVDEDRLREAFMRSWPIYGTELPASIDEIEGLTDDWAIERQSLWPKKAAKDGWSIEILPLLDVVRLIRERIGPVIEKGHKLAA